ncbi:MAG: MBL fold metallo-hydrolase [Chlamydiae bacterium]|nr:MBL fold metallo-hydrolase [Chlamydiota bacterium]
MKIETAYNNLQVLSYRKVWELECKNDQIKEASFIKKIYYWIVSFFSSYHQTWLQKISKDSCDTTLQYLKLNSRELLPERQKILFDKAENLLCGRGISYKCDLKERSWNWTHVMPKDKELMEPFIENNRYYNDEEDTKINLKGFFSSVERLLPHFSFSKNLETEIVQKEEPIARSENLKVHWIGHSCFLIQGGNQNILVDPNFSSFNRVTPCGIELKDLPKIDVIVISHNHPSHMDEKSLEYFRKFQPKILVGAGMKSWFVQKGFDEKNIFEHEWWEKTIAEDKNKQIKFIAVPSRHSSMSMRGVKANQALWCGWIIEVNNKKIYFASDTGYNKKMFKQIKGEFGEINLALLPISPKSKDNLNLGINDFVKAADEIRSSDTEIIPMHWGTFKSGKEEIEAPKKELEMVLTKRPDLNVRFLKIGQAYQVHDQAEKNELIG